MDTTVKPVSPDEVITKLRHCYEEALALGQASAAIKAAELLGKYIGLFGTSAPISNPLSPDNINDPRLNKLSKMADALEKSLN